MMAPSPPLMQDLGKLRWRCRRGMKELDVLLSRYVEEALLRRIETPSKRRLTQLLETKTPSVCLLPGVGAAAAPARGSDRANYRKLT